jgi:hypothetical protein
LFIAELICESLCEPAAICGNETRSYLVQARFRDDNRAFLRELTDYWRPYYLHFDDKSGYDSISGEDKNEISRLTFAGLGAGQIQVKNDE